MIQTKEKLTKRNVARERSVTAFATEKLSGVKDPGGWNDETALGRPGGVVHVGFGQPGTVGSLSRPHTPTN